MNSESKKMILHIITGFSTGGAERMLVRLLAVDRSRQMVLSLRGDGPQGDALRALGIPVHVVGLRLWCLLRLLRRLRPDVVVGWMYHSNLVATLAGCLYRAPVVWNIRHSVADLRHEKRLLRWMIRAGGWLSSTPRALVYNSAVSAAQHAELGYDVARAVVVPNGVDTAQFHPSSKARAALCAGLGLDAESFIVGHMARFHPMKDHLGFLRAAALLRESVLEAHFVMAGCGVDLANDEFLAEIDRLGLAGRVHLLGERSDVAALLAGLDLFVLSSAWGEGFPNVVLEAMACGVPVVTTDVGDASVVVGDAGLAVLPGDPKVLAESMSIIHRLGFEGRMKLGLLARKRAVEHFDIQTVSQYYRATWGLTKASSGI